jgi:hypothetical protein
MRVREILDERSVDPVDLANRAGKRYGTQQKDYGYTTSGTVQNKYIPLKSYDDDTVDEMEQELFDVYNEFGWRDASSAERKKIRQKVEQEAKTNQTVAINKLKATQPFVRIEDPEILKNKVSTTKKIVVIKFADDLYIRDGHHAVLAARLRGENTIPAEVIDLDYLQNKYL